jgi:outer membrane protein assembly factor BamB
VFVCLDADSGEEIWRVDFVKKFRTPLPSFGFVCSPLVDGGTVYVQAGASVVKLDKKTGRVLWRTLRDGGGMFGSAFSSPIIATLAGRRQLVVQTRKMLAGVDPDKGDVLWTQDVPAFRGMNILTPVIFKDGVFTSSYRNKSWLFRVSRSEDRFQVNTAWSNDTRGYMCTPVVIDGYAYFHLQNRSFTCIDLETGERKWTSPKYGKYASLVFQDHRILALSADGRLLLIKANPRKFELIDEMPLQGRQTWAHLAVSGNELFVRELGALAVYSWTSRNR